MAKASAACDVILHSFPPLYFEYALELKRHLRYEVSYHRRRLPSEERLQALLWSWPVRRALLTKPRDETATFR
jgi:hypothetical protein